MSLPLNVKRKEEYSDATRLPLSVPGDFREKQKMPSLRIRRLCGEISISDKYAMNLELSPYIHLYTIRTRFSRHYCTLKARWRHPDHHTALCTNRALIHNPLGNQTYNQPTRVVRIRESQQR